jgi:hypothetical protein
MAPSDIKPPLRVGEVIAANSSGFVAQCYQLYCAPAIGQFVRAGSPAIYGIVCQVRTEPLDPSRPVLARGENAETEEEIYRDNPQISRLLTSRFETLIVGYQAEEVFCQHLPPLPPRVHSFVHLCSLDEVSLFAESLDFLRLLVRAGATASDEVIGACVIAAAATSADSQELMIRAGRVLATELSGDLPRINAILRRITA